MRKFFETFLVFWQFFISITLSFYISNQTNGLSVALWYNDSITYFYPSEIEIFVNFTNLTSKEPIKGVCKFLCINKTLKYDESKQLYLSNFSFEKEYCKLVCKKDNSSAFIVFKNPLQRNIIDFNLSIEKLENAKLIGNIISFFHIPNNKKLPAEIITLEDLNSSVGLNYFFISFQEKFPELYGINGDEEEKINSYYFPESDLLLFENSKNFSNFVVYWNNSKDDTLNLTKYLSLNKIEVNILKETGKLYTVSYNGKILMAGNAYIGENDVLAYLLTNFSFHILEKNQTDFSPEPGEYFSSSTSFKDFFFLTGRAGINGGEWIILRIGTQKNQIIIRIENFTSFNDYPIKILVRNNTIFVFGKIYPEKWVLRKYSLDLVYERNWSINFPIGKEAKPFSIDIDKNASKAIISGRITKDNTWFLGFLDLKNNTLEWNITSSTLKFQDVKFIEDLIACVVYDINESKSFLMIYNKNGKVKVKVPLNISIEENETKVADILYDPDSSLIIVYGYKSNNYSTQNESNQTNETNESLIVSIIEILNSKTFQKIKTIEFNYSVNLFDATNAPLFYIFVGSTEENKSLYVLLWKFDVKKVQFKKINKAVIYFKPFINKKLGSWLKVNINCENCSLLISNSTNYSIKIQDEKELYNIFPFNKELNFTAILGIYGKIYNISLNYLSPYQLVFGSQKVFSNGIVKVKNYTSLSSFFIFPSNNSVDVNLSKIKDSEYLFSLNITPNQNVKLSFNLSLHDWFVDICGEEYVLFKNSMDGSVLINKSCKILIKSDISPPHVEINITPFSPSFIYKRKRLFFKCDIKDDTKLKVYEFYAFLPSKNKKISLKCDEENEFPFYGRYKIYLKATDVFNKTSQKSFEIFLWSKILKIINKTINKQREKMVVKKVLPNFQIYFPKRKFSKFKIFEVRKEVIENLSKKILEKFNLKINVWKVFKIEAKNVSNITFSFFISFKELKRLDAKPEEIIVLRYDNETLQKFIPTIVTINATGVKYKMTLSKFSFILIGKEVRVCNFSIICVNKTLYKCEKGEIKILKICEYDCSNQTKDCIKPSHNKTTQTTIPLNATEIKSKIKREAKFFTPITFLILFFIILAFILFYFSKISQTKFFKIEKQKDIQHLKKFLNQKNKV